MSTLREIFLNDLATIYCAETQMVKSLPKLAEAVTDPDLKEALETHLSETQDQVARLEEMFKEIGFTPKNKKCRVMDALLAEGVELANEEAGDAAILGAAQKVEHFEISSYQTLLAWGRALDESDMVETLEEILEEEELTNDKLTDIADTSVIPDAARLEDEEDEEEQEAR